MKFPKTFSLLLLPVAGSYAQTLPDTVSLTGTIATPTASPLPPVNPTVAAFIGELSTAILYASLISNGNLPGLCPLINPPALSNITGIDGEAVQREVCGGATVVAQNATLGEIVVLENQNPGVSVLATALFAVQVAGNYAGGTDLDTLCSEIETQVINNLFINYIDNFGTRVKNYICNASKTPTTEDFVGELSTAILYASLISNDNDLAALCSLINPPALSNITGIDGETVQREVCAGSRVVALSATLGEQLVLENQKGVSVLATALFAVQVAGNYAGGTDLDTLCSEIETQLITNLFFNYIDNFGTRVKNYICNAAKNTTSSPTPTPAPSPSPTFSNTTETCASPTGFGNKVVRVPDSLADEHFYPDVDNFDARHALFQITDLNIDLPEAVVTSFCLDKCIAFPSSPRPCHSIFVNQGKPFALRDGDPPPPPPGSNPPPPPSGSDTAPRWYCDGFDVPLTAAVYRIIDAPESYLYGLGVNRVCNETYRAY